MLVYNTASRRATCQQPRQGVSNEQTNQPRVAAFGRLCTPDSASPQAVRSFALGNLGGRGATPVSGHLSQSIHRALRPLTSLSIVGALVVIAAFALLNLTNSKPAAAAQQVDGNGDSSTVAVVAGPAAITLTVSNADLDAGDFLFFDLPGYRARNTMQTVDDPNSDAPTARIPDPQRACVVAVANPAGDTDYIGGNPAGSAYACQSKSDGTGIFGWAEIITAADVPDYRVTITDVDLINVYASIGRLTLRENSGPNAIDRTTNLPGTGTANLIGVGYDNAATTPRPGIPFRIPGSAPDSISVSSTTASAPIQIQLTVAQLPTTLPEGSAIVLYLENDYVMPGPIRARHVWFTVSGAPASSNAGDRQASAGRHYPTGHPPGFIQIFGDDYLDFGLGTAIRVYIPDLFIGDTPGVSQGF